MKRSLIFGFVFLIIFIIFAISYFLFFKEKEEKQGICNPCEINNCICNIRYCERGMAGIYNNSKCGGIPLFSFLFSSNKLTWKPIKKGTYYLKLLCEDKEFSTCLPITVS
jgi:predicted permease